MRFTWPLHQQHYGCLQDTLTAWPSAVTSKQGHSPNGDISYTNVLL